jgi:uncharacterized membrane protein YfbV (UPF0208 family)
MCWCQKWFLKNEKTLLACISARKAIWKATTTTLPNTLLVWYWKAGLYFVVGQLNFFLIFKNNIQVLLLCFKALNKLAAQAINSIRSNKMIWFHYIIKKITTINLPYLKRKGDSDDLQKKEKKFKRKKNYKIKFQDNPLLKKIN